MNEEIKQIIQLNFVPDVYNILFLRGGVQAFVQVPSNSLQI